MKYLKKILILFVIVLDICLQGIPVYAAESENSALLQDQLEKAENLCIIQDVHNVLTEEERETLKNHFSHLLLYLWPNYGREELEMPIVTFVIDSSELPAGTGAITVASGQMGKIIMPEEMFRNHGRAKDLVAHELTHVVQDYGNTGMYWWITESIADYVTHIQVNTDTETISYEYIGGDLYEGYEVGARFLYWLEVKKAPGIVQQINRIMQKGTFKMETFQELTGQNVSDLWMEYSGQELPPMQTYLEGRTDMINVKNRAAYYYYGYEGEPSNAKALESYQEANQISISLLGKEDAGVCNALGDLYYDHGAVLGDQNYQIAEEWYIKSANTETSASTYASMKLGCVYKERNDTQQALYWFRKAIQQEEILGIHTDF